MRISFSKPSSPPTAFPTWASWVSHGVNRWDVTVVIGFACCGCRCYSAAWGQACATWQLDETVGAKVGEDGAMDQIEIQ